MRTNILILLLALFTVAIHAQKNETLSKREQRQLIKEKEKRIAAENKEAWERHVEKMLQKNEFVLEADLLHDRYGNSRYVNPPMNYILVDSLYGVIQAQSQHYLGRTGLGGEIVEGRITQFKKKKNEKKDSYQIDYTLESPLGTYYITMNILPSGKAEASVRGAYSGSRARYSGSLVSFDKYKVFKDRVF